jgi:hypothetical protein
MCHPKPHLPDKNVEGVSRFSNFNPLHLQMFISLICNVIIFLSRVRLIYVFPIYGAPHLRLRIFFFIQ